MKKRIKDLPLSTRPREKLAATGAENLTTTELIAILLGSGTSKHNALALAKKILTAVSLKTVALKDLAKISGIGPAKATQIVASIELGKRLFATNVLLKVETDQDVLIETKDLAAKEQEHIVVLYLNARSELLHKETLAIGTLNASLIEPKEIFRLAISLPAASIIIIHNHPSENPTPSEADVNFTKTIQHAGKLLGVKLLNHLIICKTSYFSFADNKTLSLS